MPRGLPSPRDIAAAAASGMKGIFRRGQDSIGSKMKNVCDNNFIDRLFVLFARSLFAPQTTLEWKWSAEGRKRGIQYSSREWRVEG